ncbi:MAG: hypothetical protein ACRDBI_12740 [Shewanella sp.]
MKKTIAMVMTAMLSVLLTFSAAHAGTVDGKMTKIRVYENGKKLEFKSKIPNVSFQLKKVDVLKAMTRVGKTLASADLEKNGLIIDVDRKVAVTLDRVGDGLYIRGKTMTMFVTEKELEKVR